MTFAVGFGCPVTAWRGHRANLMGYFFHLLEAEGALHFDLVVYVIGLGDPVGNGADKVFLLGGVNRSTQSDPAVHSGDLYTPRIDGHPFPGQNLLADLGSSVLVGNAVALAKRDKGVGGKVAGIMRRAVGLARGGGAEVRLNMISAIYSAHIRGLAEIRPFAGSEMRRVFKRLLCGVERKRVALRVQVQRFGGNNTQLVAHAQK